MERVQKVVIYDEKRTRNNIVRFCEKTKCAATTSRVNGHTRQELIKSVGMEGFVLFHYYVDKQNVPDFLFLDHIAARALVTSDRKIASLRRRLIKESWFLQYNEYFDKKTDQYVIRTLLGRDNIINNKQRDVKENQVLDLRELLSGEEL